MRVVNIMLSRGFGGIEQAFADYDALLRRKGHDVINVTVPEAMALQWLDPQSTVKTVRNFGRWDPWAAWRLRRLLRAAAPDAVIAHGNRALVLACGGLVRALKTTPTPLLIGVAHNYNFEALRPADAVLAVSADLTRKLQATTNVPVLHLPNSVPLPPPVTRPAFRTVPVIGAMGRMVAKKGFDVLLQACARLPMPHQIVLAGDGEERASLQALAERLHIADRVLFPGRIDDKAAFFASIDVFCLPSRHEPFGIVLLEALAHSVPTVTSDAEGPREIVTPDVDACMTTVGDVEALAHALEIMLSDPEMAYELGEAGRHTAECYGRPAAADRLDAALRHLLNRPEVGSNAHSGH